MCITSALTVYTSSEKISEASRPQTRTTKSPSTAGSETMKPAAFLAIGVAGLAQADRIVLTNDDGWATAPTRMLFNLMNETHDVVLSAPADNKSGHGESTLFPHELALNRRRLRDEKPGGPCKALPVRQLPGW